MGQRKGSAKTAAVVAAGIAAAVAAVAIGARRWRRSRTTGQRADDGGAVTTEPTYWTCACGERLRTVGTGRHQVHWLADAPESEPLLGDSCPSCGRPLAVAAELAAQQSSSRASPAGADSGA
jgi:hypothetical protein